MLSLCVNERSTQPLERHSLLLFRLGRKNKKNGSSRTDRAQFHTAHGCSCWEEPGPRWCSDE